MSVTGGRILTAHATTPGDVAATATGCNASAGALIAVAAFGLAPGASASDFVISNSGAALTWIKAKTSPVSPGGGGLVQWWLANAPSGLSSQTITATLTTDGDVDYFGFAGGVALMPFALAGANPAASAVGASGAGLSATNNLTTPALASVAASSLVLAAGIEANGLGQPDSSDLTKTAEALAHQICVIDGTKTGTGSVTANLDAFGTSAADWAHAEIEILVASGGGGSSANKAGMFLAGL